MSAAVEHGPLSAPGRASSHDATAPCLPDAADRAGVAPGWWVTGVRHGSTVSHRLQLAPGTGRRMTRAVCGRTVIRPQGPSGSSTACGDCVKKAARALPPEPLERAEPPAPSAPRRRSRSGTGEQPNTAATRTRRRVAFRRQFTELIPDADIDYVAHDYGVAAAQQAMADALTASRTQT